MADGVLAVAWSAGPVDADGRSWVRSGSSLGNDGSLAGIRANFSLRAPAKSRQKPRNSRDPCRHGADGSGNFRWGDSARVEFQIGTGRMRYGSKLGMNSGRRFSLTAEAAWVSGKALAKADSTPLISAVERADMELLIAP